MYLRHRHRWMYREPMANTVRTRMTRAMMVLVTGLAVPACGTKSALHGDAAGSGGGSSDTSVDNGVVLFDGPTMCRAPSPDYGPTSVFEVIPNSTLSAATTCSAACGDSAWPQSMMSFPNIDVALPYGSCAPGTPSCSTAATVPCACAEGGGGPADAFNCSCEGGTWICRIRSLGTTLCLPCPDAGAGSMD